MENLLFITYAIAVVALVVAVWAVTEVIDLRKFLIRKQIQNRLQSVVQQTTKKKKGLWD